jgi:O-antigen/teichoic acid export membrane protein
VAHLGSLSIPFAALRFLSRKRAEGLGAVARLYFVLLKALLVATLAATAIALALALWKTDVLGAQLAPYRIALTVALVSAPLLAIVSMLQGVLAALDSYRRAAFLSLSGAVMLIGAAYVGARLRGLPGLYAGSLVVNVVLIAAAMLAVQHVLRPARADARAPVLATFLQEPGLWKFCTVFHVFTIASPLAYVVVRLTLLSHHGAVVAGLFAAAAGLAAVVRIALEQANRLYLTPILNKPTAKADRGAAAAEYTRVLVIAFVIGALVVVLFPRQWLVALYSARFVAAAPYLGLFMMSELLVAVAGVYIQLLLGFDDLRAQIAASVSGHVCTIAVSLALVPKLGPAGVAIAFLCGSSVMLVLSMRHLVRQHGLRVPIRPLGLLSAGLGTIGAAGWWAAGSWAPSVALRVLALGALTFGFVTLLTSEERRWLLSPWRQKAGSPPIHFEER